MAGHPLSPPLPAALRPFVAMRAAYDVDTGRPGVHRGLPGTGLTLVLPVGQPMRVGWSGGETQAGWSSVAGLHPRPAEIVHDGVQRGVYLELTVAGARRLLGLPAAALAGVLTDLGALDGLDRSSRPVLRALPERVHEAASWPQRVALVDGALLDVLAISDRADRAPSRPEVGVALSALTRGTPVAAVADEVGYSRRRLGTLVQQECGLAPKTYQRLARFERSHRLLQHAGGRRGLAVVAAEAGYADQSHLSREWVDLAGCPPSVWLREEFPSVQAGDPAEG